MTATLVLPIALPLATAGLAVLWRHHRQAQRIVTFATLGVVVLLGVRLVGATRGSMAVAADIGAWPPGLAIVLAADGLASLLLTTTAGVAVLALAFAAARGEDRHPLFLSLANVLLAGVFAALLTADLFTLFVAYEVMLVASYVLLTLRGGRRQVRAGVIYVAVNLLASTIMVVGIALLYGVAGTVSLGGLAGVVAREPGAGVGAAVLGVAVAVKAGIVPLHGWLPRAYVEAGPAVTALFSALLTKVGVYSLYRLGSLLLAGTTGWQPLALAAATITMVIGVLGAVGRGDVRGILAFHMVSQVGYLLLPLGLWSEAALAAGIVYLVQYLAVKAALFLAAGAIETLTGTGQLQQLGGMIHTRPWLAAAFGLPALALAGVPPTTGFVGKLLLIGVAFEQGHLAVGAVAIVVSLLTLTSMVKIFTGVFWGELTPAVRQERIEGPLGLAVPPGMARPTSPRGATLIARRRATELIAPAAVIGVASVVVGLGAAGLITLATEAAAGLTDPTAYLEVVSRP